jgi:hypothetical protein
MASSDLADFILGAKDGLRKPGERFQLPGKEMLCGRPASERRCGGEGAGFHAGGAG